MWLVYTLATTMLWGLAELFYKKGALEREKYAHLKICVMVGLVMGIHAVFTLLTEDFTYSLNYLLTYLPVSACYILSMAFSFFGMRFIEESISDPIENTSGAMCALMCVLFLGEQLDAMIWVAIGIIAVGVVGIGFLENSGDLKRRQHLGKKLAIIAFCMPFLYALIDAFGCVLDIYFLEMETSPLLAVGATEDTIELIANTSYELTFALVGLVMFIFMKLKGVQFGGLVEQKDKALAAVCETAGQLTYVYAMASGNGAIAAPIISAVCVVSLILSRIFLKEKLTRKQYAFIAIIIIGILMLAVIEGE
ncbi:MAG: EamA family transporter [Clostridia bacterium]|nr:EamA family transporter [Clostridia bacterium]